MFAREIGATLALAAGSAGCEMAVCSTIRVIGEKLGPTDCHNFNPKTFNPKITIANL